MDKLFRLVFFNKVIRKYIFKAISNLNKEQGKVVKKYGQCKIKWIAQNKHFQLLVFRFKNEIKKRMEFTDDLFYSCFLQHNKDLQLLKDIFELFPNYNPSTACRSKIIEYSCLNSNNETIINYLINEHKIIPTLKSVQHLCSIGQLEMVKSFMDIGYFSIDQISDIGLLQCALQAKDIQLYKQIIKCKPTLSKSIDSTKSKQLLIDSGNVEFFRITFKKMIKFELNLKISYPRPYHLDGVYCRHGSFEIVKYLVDNGFPKFNYRDNYLSVYLQGIVSRPIKDTKRMDILKYFIEKLEISTYVINNDSVFESCCQSNNLEAIIYFDTRYGDSFKILSQYVDSAITHSSFDIFDWIYNYRPVDASPYGFSILGELIEQSDNSPETKLKLINQRETIFKFRRNNNQ